MSAISSLGTLDSLKFDNSFTRALPADPVIDNNSRLVNAACYSRVSPMPFPKAALVSYSRELAMELGLNPTECLTQRFVDVFSGTELLPGMQPFAACYGGHQFGKWAGQLGDGRAINLGEIVGKHARRWSLQLKGAGPTPYSRNADGFAVLRSSIREFLCSEAMHHLRVPTTRALSLLTTGTQVERDMFYDGHSSMEPGAIVCRAAPSFIRFGNFELFTSRNQIDILKKLADYTIEYFFPHLGKPSKEVYLLWFNEVCRSTARLITEWMRVGFVHGVMNTDNMSILGLTVDYGPYGWLEDYDPYWTPNTTDAGGRRYAYGKQAEIAHWNLYQLANAIYPLIEDAEALEQALAMYQSIYDIAWRDMMSSKLGLLNFVSGRDELLFQDLMRNLKNTETDMTLFFRLLANLEVGKGADADYLLSIVSEAFYADSIDPSEANNIKAWLLRYLQRLRDDGRADESRRQQMNAVNPLYVLRNYLAQEAIEKAEQGSYSRIHELQEVLKSPYTEQPGKEHFAAKRPEWARHKAGASMLSCSS
tara:strand:- start:89901 stop:91505 length:1605 start_codon:yes stop_codon:yes gene_type:complete